MSSVEPNRLLPTFSMVEQALSERFALIDVRIADQDARYRGVRRFCGQGLRPDILYVITARDADAFPVHEYAWVSPDPVRGSANHICCPMRPVQEILELLLDFFLELQTIEEQVLALGDQESDLGALCALGEQLLGNPVCIHDNWFMILARSRTTQLLIPPSDQTWEAFPKDMVDEFGMDDDYQRTYQMRGAQIWESGIGGKRVQTLYVNLSERGSYRGRLLVTDLLRPFRHLDHALAELLARQALRLMKAGRNRSVTGNRSTDDILYDILNGRYTPASEFSALLRVLNWEKNHRFLCLRIQRQEPGSPGATEHILHSALFQAFPGSYVMMTGEQQCVIINLTRTPCSLSMVRHRLAPLCRDYYQYGGISSPVEGFRELPVAYHQARQALDHAFRLRNEKWIVPFHSIVLDYMLTRLNTPMQLRHLVAPQLLELIEHDRQKGTRLFETFRVWLLSERSIPKTAAALIIHRTTLTYRLGKIHSILNLDLEDPQTRLYLQLSLRMLEEEKTVKLSEQMSQGDGSGEG